MKKRFSEDDLVGYLSGFEEAARAYEQSLLTGDGLSQGINAETYLVRLREFHSFLNSFTPSGEYAALDPIPGWVGCIHGRITQVDRKLASMKKKIIRTRVGQLVGS
jgi:hypothetical protein